VTIIEVISLFFVEEEKDEWVDEEEDWDDDEWSDDDDW
jgi:hypothetical protein